MERRLAAILAADVVGYSRLMEQDEVGTLGAWADRRKSILEPQLIKYHGRLVRLMGDGSLAEFASAVDAVQCAVDIQKAMKEANARLSGDRAIVLRVGLNLGDVVVEDGDLYGDGVNIAARLEAMAEPGGICLSAAIHQQVERLLPFAFMDLGDQSLKNIARPVRVYSIADDDGARGTHRTAIPMGRVSLASSDKPSIAVLPLTNMSGDPKQEYFSDGLTEDIITELSRFNRLLVISRHSSFAYRGRSIDARQIGRELNVQYLLEGSIRLAGLRARVTVQLINAIDGSHLWAEKYDRDVNDIFAIQDEISRAVASRVTSRMQDDRLERIASKPPASITAYEWWLRGKRAFELWTGDGMLEARASFERALQIDPNYARALAGLAFVHNMATSYTGWGISLDESHETALTLARRAAQLDPTDNLAEIVLGWCSMFRRQYDQAALHFDRALALNPNVFDGFRYRVSFFAYTSQCDRAMEQLAQIKRLDPSNAAAIIGTSVVAFVLCRRYEEAIRIGRQTPTDVWPEYPGWLAVAHAHLGRLSEARSLGAAFRHNVRAIWRGDSNVDDKELVRWFFLDNPIQHQADIDHFRAGFRIAGLEV